MNYALNISDIDGPVDIVTTYISYFYSLVKNLSGSPYRLTDVERKEIQTIAIECANAMDHAIRTKKPFNPPVAAYVQRRLLIAREIAESASFEERTYPNNLSTRIAKMAVKPEVHEVFHEVLVLAASMAPFKPWDITKLYSIAQEYQFNGYVGQREELTQDYVMGELYLSRHEDDNGGYILDRADVFKQQEENRVTIRKMRADKKQLIEQIKALKKAS